VTPLQDKVELVAVINSFNRNELLQSALGSLAAALRKSSFGSAMIVFDAGSTDGSVEFVESWRSHHPGDNLLLVRPTDERASFSEGVNRACAIALERFRDSRWLLLYETDNCLLHVKPVHDAIALLESEPRLGAVGFTVRLHNGARCGYGMRFPTATALGLGQNLALRWNLYRPNDSTWQTTNEIRWRTCDVVFTSPLLVRREAWQQVGGFDNECFPFSDSDLDWAWRCAEAGWKMGVIETDAVVHDNLRQASPGSANRVIDFHRSRLRLLKRHCGAKVAWIKPMLFVRHCFESLALLRGDPEKLAKRRQMLRTVWNDYSTDSPGR
jgi:GT2 family glycosyltransferase